MSTIPIQHRRDSAAAWTATNPVLRAGEWGVELDTGAVKLGDGATAWNALAYFTGATGPAGPAGATGPAGPTGPAGIDGRDVLLYRAFWVRPNKAAASNEQHGGINYGNSAGTQASADDADGVWNSYTSNASTNAEAYRADWNGIIRRDHKPIVAHVIKTGSDLTNVRYAIGEASSTSFASGTPTSHHALFLYDTSIHGGGTWRVRTGNGSSGTTIDTGIAIAADTVYVLRIEYAASEVRFYINGTLAATATSTLPTASTWLYSQTGLRTLDAVAKAFKFGTCAGVIPFNPAAA